MTAPADLAEEMSGPAPTFYLLQRTFCASSKTSEFTVMAVQLDSIRATAERVAASHNLDLVDIEFQGGAKYRTLRDLRRKERRRARQTGFHRPIRRSGRPAEGRPGRDALRRNPRGLRHLRAGLRHRSRRRRPDSRAPSTLSRSRLRGSSASSCGQRTTRGSRAAWSSCRRFRRSTKTGSGKVV